MEIFAFVTLAASIATVTLILTTALLNAQPAKKEAGAKLAKVTLAVSGVLALVAIAFSIMTIVAPTVS